MLVVTQGLQQRLLHLRQGRSLVDLPEAGVEGELSGCGHQFPNGPCPGPGACRVAS